MPKPPGSQDHLRPGAGDPIVIYADFECPRCALAYERLADSGVQLGLRHFPVRSRHPRAMAAACASEAAASQGRFWEMAEAMFRDQGRLDDPHLWAIADSLGIDIDVFEAERRSAEVTTRIQEGLRLAVREGVIASPTLLAGGALHQGVPDAAWIAAQVPG